jgi:diacylglycerol O-acyltransferase
LPSVPDRLSALDCSFLVLDSPQAPLHVGWTMRFAGSAPSLAALRRHLDARLGIVPRFRRCVTTPALGMGDPRWVDDPGFDIAHHVHELTLAAPGGPAQLRELAGLLLSRPLDRGRPLWQLYLIRGMGSDGFALVGQAHHALVDGIAAIEVAMLLFTPDPPAPAPGQGPGPPNAWRPRPPAAGGVTSAVGVRARTAVRLARDAAAPAGLRDVARRATGLTHEVRAAADGLGRVTGPVASTVLDRGVGPRRAVAYVQAPLDGLRAAGRRHSATLNDVLLTACSLAFGRTLAAHGEHPEQLRVLVPVNTREDDPAALGNQLSFLAVELPVSEVDAITVLRTVRDRTCAAKAITAADGGLQPAQVMRAADLLPAAAAGVAARLAYRAASFNAVVSSVPGPDTELSLLGRPLRSVHPAVPVAPGHALSVGAVSYLGSLHVGLYADADALPDTAGIGRDLECALGMLRLQAPLAPTPWRARARSRREGGRPPSGQRAVKR